MSTEYSAAGEATTAAMAIVTRLRCSEDVPQGTEVAKVSVLGSRGERFEWPLRAGVETAETQLSGALQQRARHQPTTVFESSEDSLDYLATFTMPTPIRAERMEIEVTTAGWLDVMKLSLLDPEGRALPQEVPGLLLNPGRWRQSRRFATSRTTDRGGDDQATNETNYLVYENQRALPRAWVAHQIVPVEDKDGLNAIHYSLLPDGRRFDPSEMALVANGDLASTPSRRRTGGTTGSQP